MQTIRRAPVRPIIELGRNTERRPVEGHPPATDAEGDQASPRRYAEMVTEDRELRIAGYEVFRFGGYEFRSPDGARAVLRDFFERIFALHGYQYGRRETVRARASRSRGRGTGDSTDRPNN
jgi:hypothetical protein